MSEPVITATVSPRSVGGASLFDARERITCRTVGRYASTPQDRRDAKRALEGAGFTVHDEGSSEQTLSISGTPEQFRDFFGAHLEAQEAEVTPGRRMSFMAPPEPEAATPLRAPDAWAALIEGAAISRPPTYFAPSPIPPTARVAEGAYPYLTVPDGVATMLGASRAHRMGWTGRGVVVAMIDTGHHAHPFFAERGYRLLPTLLAPGAERPEDDLSGHGTGESANVFACAPDCRLRPIKNAADAVGAFNVALNSAPAPQIITNSWGYDEDKPGTAMPAWLRPLEAAVANAVARGVVVLFAGGNGQLAFPASHPDVIAVGGVHVNLPDHTDLEASSYASSFASTWYEGREVPDLCGLTGRAVPLMGGVFAPSVLLPVQAGAELDGITPATAATGGGSDGWGLFSGTSAACPQLAGIAALLLAREPGLSPSEVRDALTRGARDVARGVTATGDVAALGPDRATGAGLADAERTEVAAPALAAVMEVG